MKKIIIFFIIFIITIILIIKFSYSTKKINFSEYYLKGFFGVRNCYELARGNSEFCEKTYFNIYDNRIFLDVEGETAYIEKTPNGKYILNTNEGSKIKIKIKNGYIENFKLLSNEKNFIKSEEIIENNNYCKIANFISKFDSCYRTKDKNKYFFNYK